MTKYLIVCSFLVLLALAPATGYCRIFCSSGGWGQSYDVCEDSATGVPIGEYSKKDGYRIFGRLLDYTWDEIVNMNMKIALILKNKPLNFYVIETNSCKRLTPQDDRRFVCYMETDLMHPKWGTNAAEKKASLLDPNVTEMTFAAIPINDLPIYDSDKVAALPNVSQWEGLQKKLSRAADKDKDHDGIMDDVDDCPDIANLDDQHAYQVDDDKDGFGNPCDKCPSIYSIDNSCGIGLIDKVHAKLQAKPVYSVIDTGKPDDQTDVDGDGVLGDDDKCPTKGGTVNADGCPKDSDGDGVVDDYDKCISEPGTAENDGCPEEEAPGGGVTNVEVNSGVSGTNAPVIPTNLPTNNSDLTPNSTNAGHACQLISTPSSSTAAMLTLVSTLLLLVRRRIK